MKGKFAILSRILLLSVLVAVSSCGRGGGLSSDSKHGKTPEPNIISIKHHEWNDGLLTHVIDASYNKNTLKAVGDGLKEVEVTTTYKDDTGAMVDFRPFRIDCKSGKYSQGKTRTYDVSGLTGRTIGPLKNIKPGPVDAATMKVLLADVCK